MQRQSQPESSAQLRRFTIDGSEALESHLGEICAEVGKGIHAILPAEHVEAVVLGGGYGRGQGGVLRTEDGDQPYNDMEFYVFIRGNHLWREHRYGTALGELANRLSSQARLHVEFKVDSLARLRQSPVTMFSYDLVSGHRIVIGPGEVFHGCNHHLQAEKIPAAEATRLLLNRGTGLLLAKELLHHPKLELDELDFVARNLAKAQLALGDAVLTACGQYHWSCSERGMWLKQLDTLDSLSWLPQVRVYHEYGTEFKLHPQRRLWPISELKRQHETIAGLALQVWLWLENRRLNCTFASARDYAFDPVEKCSGTSVWRNFLLNLRTFGPKAVLDTHVARYPRERLFNALALLLWNDGEPQGITERRHLQKQLRTGASEWGGLLRAYKQIWPKYG